MHPIEISGVETKGRVNDRQKNVGGRPCFGNEIEGATSSTGVSVTIEGGIGLGARR